MCERETSSRHLNRPFHVRYATVTVVRHIIEMRSGKVKIALGLGNVSSLHYAKPAEVNSRILRIYQQR